MNTLLNIEPSPNNYPGLVYGNDEKILEELLESRFYKKKTGIPKDYYLSAILPTTLEGLFALYDSEKEHYKESEELKNTFKRKIALSFYNKKKHPYIISLIMMVLIPIFSSMIFRHFYEINDNDLYSYLHIAIMFITLILCGIIVCVIEEKAITMIEKSKDIIKKNKNIINNIKSFTYLTSFDNVYFSKDNDYYPIIEKMAKISFKIIKTPYPIIEKIGIENYRKLYDDAMRLLLFLTANNYKLDQELQEQYKQQLTISINHIEKLLMKSDKILEENIKQEALLYYPIIKENEDTYEYYI